MEKNLDKKNNRNTENMLEAHDTENQELSKEEMKDAVLMNENDIIKGMISAADYRSDKELQQPILIKRNGNVLFSFRIRPLSDEELDFCREKATKYVRNKKMAGMKLPEDTDMVKFRNLKIYNATIEEDKKKTWENQKVKDALHLREPLEIIEKCLLPGEKNDITEAIDKISGFTDDMDEVVKN